MKYIDALSECSTEWSHKDGYQEEEDDGDDDAMMHILTNTFLGTQY